MLQVIKSVASLAEEESKALAETVSDELIGRGILKWSTAAQSLSPVNISLLPMVLLDAEQYEFGRRLTPLFHQICDNMVLDTDFLLHIYESMSEIDEFVQRFRDITSRVYKNGPKSIKEALRVYVTRSDYLVENGQLKQVEINLSSVVGMSTSDKLASFHERFVSTLKRHQSITLEGRPSVSESHCVKHFGEGMRTVHERYCKRRGLKDATNVASLFVPSRSETNLPEMMSLIEAMRDENVTVYKIDWDTLVERPALRLVADDILQFNCGVLGYPHKADDWIEVSIVYFRTGYRPDQYPTEKHWEIRELLELSQSAVIPSVISQLTGLKKAQQLWCLEEVLSRFIPNRDEAALLAKCFVDQVDPSENHPLTRAIMAEAMINPNNFVLKPQREGGGNNFYADSIPPLLEGEKGKKCSSYVLMRKIQAETSPAIFLKSKELVYVPEVVSEVGYFGFAIYDGQSCVHNETFGTLLRTKAINVNEGSVSLEASVYDSVWLR